ncbi:MAG: phosphate ABC transporter permease subunit PstC [Candidatus Improbicoccus pseudotrichonymphae]|uniref:Phosphate transport system permease protein n=1 Tax=Candidatus Improbicoccus pseudotrichonymphae TaxID=3033792 RepID=A0AA48I2C4_9FIRM|nr:MAG: phosphate ABC transporter permease subunit PstC [Candidatus Improbicoccus pseudotrichonymphae]
MNIFVYDKNSNNLSKKVVFYNFFLFVFFNLFLINFISFFKIRIDENFYNLSILQIPFLSGFSCDGQIVYFPLFLRLLGVITLFCTVLFAYFLFKKNNLFILISVPIFLLLTCTFFVNYFSKIYLCDFNKISISFIILFFLCSYKFFFQKLNSGEEVIFKFLSSISVVILFSIGIYVCIMGLPAIVEIGFKEFISGIDWKPKENIFGILPLIVSSIVSSICALILATPFAVLFAVYLLYYTSGKITLILEMMVKILMSIPSVIFGFFGMLIIVPLVRFIFYGHTTGDSLLSVIIVLCIMILPTIISFAKDAIKSVPEDYQEVALSLGQTKIKSIFTAVLPSAFRGIIAGMLLSLSRAIGESVAIIMVAGNTISMFKFLQPVKLLTTGISLEMSYASGLHRKALFAIALVLFAINFVINLFFSFLSKKNNKE